jgi:cadmium resistance protein CadD (predicted permease)
MFTVIPVAAGAYLATNLDNLALLIVVLTNFRDRRGTVVAGYVAGAFILAAAGFLIGGAAGALPVEYLGFLGIVPMAIGVVGIGRLVRGSGSSDTVVDLQRGQGHGAFAATTLSQLGNGSDTVITFAALFADSAPGADSLILLTLLGTTTMFAFTGMLAVAQPAVVGVIDRHANRITPFILVIVGGYILANTASDLVAG